MGGKPRPAARLRRALADLAGALESLPGPSMIIGGIAVIAHGVPRVTRDIDATIAAAANPVPALLAAMAARGIEPRIDDAVSFAAGSGVLLLRHRPSGVDIDLSLAMLDFESEALRRAQTAFVEGVRLRLARPEDLIIYKSAAWRPQDQQDIERLLALHGGTMDLDRIRRVTAEIAAALETPERVTELERLLAHQPR